MSVWPLVFLGLAALAASQQCSANGYVKFENGRTFNYKGPLCHKYRHCAGDMRKDTANGREPCNEEEVCHWHGSEDTVTRACSCNVDAEKQGSQVWTRVWEGTHCNGYYGTAAANGACHSKTVDPKKGADMMLWDLDIKPPTLQCPCDMTYAAKDTSATVAHFWSDFMAEDAFQGKQPVTCDKNSGDDFAYPGPHEVECQAKDEAGQVGYCKFVVAFEAPNPCSGVRCSAQDQCHDVGTCDKATGQCTNPIKENAACDDGNDNTEHDKCSSTGVCTGVDPCAGVTCPAPTDTECHLQSTCSRDLNGACPDNRKPDGTACDDGNALTENDVCTDGVCEGTGKCENVVCATNDQCHAVGQCIAATGHCTHPAKPDGTTCDDGVSNTINDQCISGTCVGTDRCAGVVCSAKSQCHEIGDCDSSTGKCADPLKPDGVACDDGNLNTDPDLCTAGTCTGTPVPPPPPSDCAPGWWSPDCSKECPNGHANPCNGHGKCSDNRDGTGVCTCHDSDTAGHWTGDACDKCKDGYAGATCTEISAGNPTNDDCHCDIMFVWDESSSVAPGDYTKQKQFTKTVVELLKGFLTPTGARIGIVSFATDTDLVSDVTTDYDALMASIDNHKQLGGVTFTNKALDLAMQRLVATQRGPGSCKTIKLVTDGKSTVPTETTKSAIAARAAGINIMAVGVGAADDDELLSIAGDQKNVMHVQGFSDLDDVAHLIGDKCKNATDQTGGHGGGCDPGLYGPACDKECPGGKDTPCSLHGQCDGGKSGSGNCTCDDDDAKGHWWGTSCNECADGYTGPTCTTKDIDDCHCDIVFLWDESGSVQPAQYTQMKTFTQTILDSIKDNMSPTGVSVGIVGFSNSARTIQAMTNNYATITQAVTSATQVAGFTYTDKGLTAARALLESIPSAPGKCKAVKVVTDGRSTSTDGSSRKTETIAAGNDLKAHGINIMMIGVGNVDEPEMDAVASQPLHKNSLHLTDYGSLDQLAHVIGDKCKVNTNPDPDTCPKGMFGANCDKECPGGKANPCTGHGICGEGKTGDGLCRCDDDPQLGTWTGAACDVQGYDDCHCDTVIVWDESGSVSMASWIKMKDFTKTYLHLIKPNLAPTDARVGIVAYSNTADQVIGVTEDFDALIAAVDNRQRMAPGYTYTDLAIAEAVQELTDAPQFPGPAKCKTIKIITDGVSLGNDQVRRTSLTLFAADQAKAAGITIFAVGVGAGVDHAEIVGMASDPKAKNAVEIADFSGLDSVAHLIGDKCKQNLQDGCKSVIIADLPPTQSLREGVYQQSTQTNGGRPVYMSVSHPGEMLYWTDDAWWIGPQIQAGGYGGVYVRDHAFYPEHVTATWQAFTGLGWDKSPSTLVECLGCEALLVSGAPTSQSSRNGVYVQVPGKQMNGRPVYTLHGGVSESLYFFDNQWMIGAETNGLSGLKVSDNHVAPEHIAANWEAYDGNAWVAADHVDVVCTTPPATSADDCHCDFMFVLDESGSVSNAEYQEVIKFTKTVVSLMRANLGPDDVRFGIVAYSNAPTLVLPLSYDYNTIINAIDTRVKVSGWTYTDLGLATAYAELKNSARPGTKCQTIKLVTDGESKSSDGSSRIHLTEAEASRIKHEGVTIMAIGVGAGANDAELREVASSPKDKNSLHVDTFDGLDHVAHSIGDKCAHTDYNEWKGEYTCVYSNGHEITLTVDGKGTVTATPASACDGACTGVFTPAGTIEQNHCPTGTDCLVLEGLYALGRKDYLERTPDGHLKINHYNPNYCCSATCDKKGVTSDTCKTSGGGVSGAGATCVFPFTYSGKSYDHCTAKDSLLGYHWCTTDTNTGDWAYCECAIDKCQCDKDECQPGVWGQACDKECPGGSATPCNGHGTCSDGKDGTGLCECDDSITKGSWSGPACDVEVKGNDDCHCDIVFLWDESGSVSNSNWDILRDFTRTVTDLMKHSLGPQGARIGIYAFNTDAELVLPLTHEYDTIMGTIGSRTRTKGWTYTDKAIAAAAAHLMANERSPGACKAIKLVTDGKSYGRPGGDRKVETLAAAKAARNQGVNIMSVGVGNVDQDELDQMASDPLHLNSLHVNSFADLNQVAHIIGDKCNDAPSGCDMVEISGVPTMQAGRNGLYVRSPGEHFGNRQVYRASTGDVLYFDGTDDWWVGPEKSDTGKGGLYVPDSATVPEDVKALWHVFDGTNWIPSAAIVAECYVAPPVDGDCDCDVVFLWDESGSVQSDQYLQTKEFTKTVVEELKSHLSPDKAMVGIVAFSSTTETVLPLTSDYNLIMSTIAARKQNKGWTYTDEGLKKAYDVLSADPNKAKCKTIKLVTDGKSWYAGGSRKSLTLTEATRVKATGIKIMAIGVGNVDHDEINQVASAPHSKYAHHLDSYDALDLVAHAVGDQCRVGCDVLLVSGLPDYQQSRAGIYDLQAGSTFMGRPVYKNAGGEYLYFSGNSWWIGGEMKAGGHGGLYVNDFSYSADLITGEWSAYNDQTKMWETQSNVAIVCAGGTSTAVDSCACDIIFVWDESGSVAATSYEQMKEFTRTYLDLIRDNLGPNGARVGLVAFSNTASIILPITHDYNTIMSSIDNRRQKTGWTYTDLGLAKAREEFERIGDTGKCRSIKLVTDGRSTSSNGVARTSKTVAEAELVRSKGILVTAIGVGNVDENELNQVASQPLDKHSIHIDKFDGLDHVAHLMGDACVIKCEDHFKAFDMMRLNQGVTSTLNGQTLVQCQTTCYLDAACKAVDFRPADGQCTMLSANRQTTGAYYTPTSSGYVYYEVCDDAARSGSTCDCDVIFLWDESGSVSSTSYEQLKDFTRSVVNFLGAHLGPDNARVGIIAFGNTARIIEPITHDYSAIMANINQASQWRGGTYTHLALTMAYDHFVANSAPGKCKSIKIITDGRSKDGTATLAAAKKLRDDLDVNIMAIGVGAMDKSEMDGMASNPLDKNSIKVADYNGLDTLAHTLGGECREERDCTGIHCPAGQSCQVSTNNNIKRPQCVAAGGSLTTPTCANTPCPKHTECTQGRRDCGSRPCPLEPVCVPADYEAYCKAHCSEEKKDCELRIDAKGWADPVCVGMCWREEQNRYVRYSGTGACSGGCRRWTMQQCKDGCQADAKCRSIDYTKRSSWWYGTYYVCYYNSIDKATAIAQNKFYNDDDEVFAEMVSCNGDYLSSQGVASTQVDVSSVQVQSNSNVLSVVVVGTVVAAIAAVVAVVVVRRRRVSIEEGDVTLL